MMMRPEQLVLDLPVRRALGRDDFFVSPANTATVAMLDDWRRWPLARLVLNGPQASGKTHLLNIWADDNAATVVNGGDLATRPLAPLLAATALAIDDADRIANNPQAEQALFHLINGLAARGAPLLMAGQQPGVSWGAGLPDLNSRLGATAHVALSAPDDGMLAALLVKLFADRQIAVSAALIPFLVARIERSCAAAIEVVARLDRAALAHQTKLTPRFAGKILNEADFDS